jgi:hypothetical protein
MKKTKQQYTLTHNPTALNNDKLFLEFNRMGGEPIFCLGLEIETNPADGEQLIHTMQRVAI